MHTILEFVNGSNWCSVLVLIAILVVLGQRIVADQPSLHRWGLRLAVAAFVAYCLYGCVSLQTTEPNDLLGIALRGLLVGGLALGVAWISLPVTAFLYRHSIGALLENARSWTAAAKQAAAERRIRREANQRRNREQRDYERNAPLRERARQEAEVKARAETEAKRRREDARAQCELLYGLHAPDVGQRFPRQAFDDFVKKYMGDERMPEDVEQRSQQLQAIIHQHLQKAGKAQKKMTLAELAQWFVGEKQQIDAAPLPPEDKQTLLAQLEERFAKLQEKYIRGIEP